ncbi:Nucleolar protein nop-58 [Pleurostoma richardsiae]|uniref:Nucleolar protein 58 n=1 Tax=Pleurostoma richardsiae TaxID=41990 RepID=A0AA38VT02_9PEZI|nr:Nucleolar protein nop-58 [Pleurostoma richardsiae]
MPLFILSETSAGYALFKAKDKRLLEKGDLESRLNSADKINEELKLKDIVKWESAQSGLEEIAGLIEGKVTPMLSKLLEGLKDEKKVSLAVADKQLGNAIHKLPNLNITPVTDPATVELYRGIRSHLTDLVPGMQPENLRSLALGLSHSLSRHKLRFSPDKVDVMIVQAIALLDDLDKELNTYAMRVKEWYGWHFPELGKILNDNLAYARVILSMGLRTNASQADLSETLPEEIEAAVKSAAEVSMGTEITEEDLLNIRLLAEQVVSYSEYRSQLSAYLDSRMKAIAPNLTELVGTLVGARLIAHAGSLMNLAKNPGSTIQILGAEKALFRALKTKHSTPKYGLIYHASLVGQATGKNKGKIARQLASKAALGVRADALSEWTGPDGEEADDETRAALGVAARAKLENNLRRLEGKPLLSKGAAVGPNGQAIVQPSKWDVKEARKYNIDADGLAGDEPAAAAKSSKRPLIEEVKDTEMAEKGGDESDEEMGNGSAQNGTNGFAVPTSPTLSSISADSEDIPETKETKKAWKKQQKRRAERVERRTAKKEQLERRSAPKAEQAAGPRKLSEADFERLAGIAGIPVAKFKRKYERGDVELNDDGTPVVHSKKELKKLRKAEEKAVAAEPSGKRKREDEAEKPKKKKKRASEAATMA